MKTSMNVIRDEASTVRTISVDGGLPCYTANDIESFLAAFRLVYEAYVGEGLMEPNRVGLRFLPHQLLDTSSVFLATRGDDIVGTLTMVNDGELGLPIESLYPTEMAQLRGTSKRIAELTCFALNGAVSSQCFAALRGLLRSAIRLARARSIEFLTVCIHPRQASFYERRLEFTRLGPVRSCPWVCNRPAIAMVRRLSTSVVQLPDNHRGQVIRLADVRFQMARRQCREYFLGCFAEASPIRYSKEPAPVKLPALRNQAASG
jgi:hypothetical protein